MGGPDPHGGAPDTHQGATDPLWGPQMLPGDLQIFCGGLHILYRNLWALTVGYGHSPAGYGSFEGATNTLQGLWTLSRGLWILCGGLWIFSGAVHALPWIRGPDHPAIWSSCIVHMNTESWMRNLWVCTVGSSRPSTWSQNKEIQNVHHGYRGSGHGTWRAAVPHGHLELLQTDVDTWNVKLQWALGSPAWTRRVGDPGRDRGWS